MSSIGRRIRHLCSSRLKRRFVAPFFDARQERATQHDKEILQRAGVALDKVVKVRPDTRGVFLVHHPEHGRCVLKTRFALRDPQAALAGYVLAQLVAETQSPLFPQIFAATSDYILEQYIDGTPFRQWMNDSFDLGPMGDYFTTLKQWSTSGGLWTGQGNMRPYEIREICQSYMGKCFSHTRYFSATDNLRSLSQLSTNGRSFEKQIQWLVDASESVQIPHGITCGDMGNVNILVQRNTNRLINVDYEYMGPGHWGFDCGYFIASLEKIGGGCEATKQMRELAYSKTHLETAECREFFRVYTDLLSALSQAIYARC